MSRQSVTLTTTTTTTTTLVAACIFAASVIPPPPNSDGVVDVLGAAVSSLSADRSVCLISIASPENVTTLETADDDARVLAADVASALASVEHVDGAFLGPVTEASVTVYVLAREHGLVDRSALLDIEDALSETRNETVILTVRAHQGRDLRAMSEGADLLFARG
jgi:hypothetical protein